MAHEEDGQVAAVLAVAKIASALNIPFEDAAAIYLKAMKALSAAMAVKVH